MCSSRGICGGSNNSNELETSGSSAHYVLCTFGVGLIAFGVIMIVWTVIPQEQGTVAAPTWATNTTADPGINTEKQTTSSSVALVLVGAGVAMLLLSICLGLRSKRRSQNSANEAETLRDPFMQRVAGQEQQTVDPNAYNVPSYEEVIGSEDYPVRQSNLRRNNTLLPSYEDIIAAVENERTEPTNAPREDAPLNDQTPTSGQPTADPAADPASLAYTPSMPTRSGSKASRLLKPLRVRRIKSDKLHLKDFRLQIRSPTQNPVTIEPITPPPQYDSKMPELQ
ncbi:transmembrane protein 51b [Nothobranchius furzeri]|uniref:Transmembrane protein 51 n=1 Tax=Nothobranchius furzeri TaxID=105023 RepID=A0A8C6VTA1_NOTFU|nr:transmembrane protein 51 [Nothobranchius furzeri]